MHTQLANEFSNNPFEKAQFFCTSLLLSSLPAPFLSGIFAAASTAGIVLFTRSTFVQLSMHYAAIVAIGTRNISRAKTTSYLHYSCEKFRFSSVRLDAAMRYASSQTISKLLFICAWLCVFGMNKNAWL